MIAEEAGPELVAKRCHGSRCVLDNAPAEVGLVSRYLVKEIVRKDSLLSSNQVFLLLVLDRAGVDPATERESCVAGQTSKGLIHAHLVQRGELVRATGYCGASTVDFANGGRKSIKLCQVLGWQDDAGCSIDHLRWLV